MLMVLAIASALPSLASVGLVGIDGTDHPAPGESDARATVVYFVTHDCPISNRLMPEIERICGDYSSRGVQCLMAYVDPTAGVERIREHRRAYGANQPALRDSDRKLVDLVGATVTPEAVVFDSDGEVVYLGRINNLYAALGTPRRRPTEHDLRTALNEVLAGKAVSRARTQAVGCFIPTLRTTRKEVDR